MNEGTKKTWKRVIDIVITVLTALITALTTTSCIR
ncbi:MAG: smalltalk protein [Bacteroidaceae bacterium]|nr:smalltalk protein [Bacteroidaceae bacterium]